MIKLVTNHIIKFWKGTISWLHDQNPKFIATGSINRSIKTINKEAKRIIKKSFLKKNNDKLWVAKIRINQFKPIISGVPKILKPKILPYEYYCFELEKCLSRNNRPRHEKEHQDETKIFFSLSFFLFFWFFVSRKANKIFSSFHPYFYLIFIITRENTHTKRKKRKNALCGPPS